MKNNITLVMAELTEHPACEGLHCVGKLLLFESLFCSLLPLLWLSVTPHSLAAFHTACMLLLARRSLSE